MNVAFNEEGWEDYTSWTGDRKILAKINRMIEESFRDPGVGIGKPERLRENLSGFWSRRITEEDRLVYAVIGDTIAVIQARGHY